LKNFPGVWPTIFKPSSNHLPHPLRCRATGSASENQRELGSWLEEGLKIVGYTPGKFFNLQSSNHPLKKC